MFYSFSSFLLTKFATETKYRSGVWRRLSAQLFKIHRKYLVEDRGCEREPRSPGRIVERVLGGHGKKWSKRIGRTIVYMHLHHNKNDLIRRGTNATKSVPSEIHMFMSKTATTDNSGLVPIIGRPRLHGFSACLSQIVGPFVRYRVHGSARHNRHEIQSIWAWHASVMTLTWYPRVLWGIWALIRQRTAVPHALHSGAIGGFWLRELWQ